MMKNNNKTTKKFKRALTNTFYKLAPLPRDVIIVHFYIQKLLYPL